MIRKCSRKCRTECVQQQMSFAFAMKQDLCSFDQRSFDLPHPSGGSLCHGIENKPISGEGGDHHGDSGEKGLAVGGQKQGVEHWPHASST